MKVPPLLRGLCLLVVAVFWVLAVAVPLSAVLSKGLGTGGAGLLDPIVLQTARATLLQAGWSTLFSGLIGLALGLLAGAHDDRSARAARRLLALPYGIPSLVVGTAGVVWLGRSGILARAGLSLDWLYSLKAVVAAHVLLNAPLVALLVAEARRQVPDEELAAARALGAGVVARFRFVVAPRVQNAWFSALVQVFGLCAMSFVLVLLLGGGPPVETLETAIYGRLRYGWLDLPGAAACAIWQLLVTLVPWMVLTAKHSARAGSVAPRVRIGDRARWWSPGSGIAFGCAALAVLPYGVILNGDVCRVLTDGPSLRALVRPVSLSLCLCAVSSVGALALAVCAVFVMATHRRLAAVLGVLLTVPAGISVLVLGLGMWLAYGRFIDPFEGSFAAMAGLQTVVLFPAVFRILLPVSAGQQKDLLETAISAGARPLRAFYWVEWPRWKGPLWNAFALTLGAAIGEVAAVSLFYSEKLVPLPLIVTRWMAQYRFEEAQAGAALLFLLAVVCMWLATKRSQTDGVQG